MIGGTSHLSAEAIAAFADGELSTGARDRAREHMAGCLECAYAVGIQQQMKQSLCGSGGCAVPSRLMERLGGIPFSADLRPSAAEQGIALGPGGAFEFSVAAPADERAQRPAHPGSLRRGRVFRSGAAALAIGIGLTLSPSLLGADPDFHGDGVSGHQIGAIDVTPPSSDTSNDPAQR